MEPNNLENQIKSKLAQRELSPSQQSWSKLSERLDSFENNKKKTNYWWLAVAATIVLALFAGFSILTRETEEAIPNIIVENPNKESEINISQFNDSVTNASETMVFESPIDNIVDKKNKVSSREVLNREPKLKNTPVVIEANNADLNNIKEDLLDYEAQKLLEVVAQIKQLNERNNQVTEAEVDSLLKAAQKDIFKQKLINQVTRTVDANALLLEVEDDLNGSFKAKVYEALKSGFISVKTAVADRKY